MENHPSRHQKRNSIVSCFVFQGMFEDVSIINEVLFKKLIQKSVDSFGIDDFISILVSMS